MFASALSLDKRLRVSTLELERLNVRLVMDPLWSHIGKDVLEDPFGHPMEMPFVQVDLRVGESTGKPILMGYIRKWATPCSLRYASRKHCELRKALYRHRKTSIPTNTTKNSFVWKHLNPQHLGR